MEFQFSNEDITIPYTIRFWLFHNTKQRTYRILTLALIVINYFFIAKQFNWRGKNIPQIISLKTYFCC